MAMNGEKRVSGGGALGGMAVTKAPVAVGESAADLAADPADGRSRSSIQKDLKEDAEDEEDEVLPLL